MRDLNQLLLEFDLKQNYKNEDFYVNKSNFFAFSLIEKWPKWEKNILNIYGDKYCGKTHLSNIFKKQHTAFKMQANEFNHESLKEFKVFENLILDDFDENIDEKLMYTLFNVAGQDNKFILINSLQLCVLYLCNLNLQCFFNNFEINRFLFFLTDFVKFIYKFIYLSIRSINVFDNKINKFFINSNLSI